MEIEVKIISRFFTRRFQKGYFANLYANSAEWFGPFSIEQNFIELR